MAVDAADVPRQARLILWAGLCALAACTPSGRVSGRDDTNDEPVDPVDTDVVETDTDVDTDADADTDGDTDDDIDTAEDTGEPSQLPRRLLGLCDGWDTPALDLEGLELHDRDAADAKALGLTLIRPHRPLGHVFSMNIVRPPDASVWDWELADHVVKTANEAGIEIVGTLQPFADVRRPADAPFGLVPSMMPDDAATWTGFVEAVVERYDGDGSYDMPGLGKPVRRWEIGNEPNCGSADVVCHQGFLDLVVTGYVAAHKSNPDAIVAAGAAAPLFGPTEVNESADAVYAYFIDHGGLGYTDALNVHYRTGSVDPDVGTYLQAWRDRAGPDLQIWLTETATRSVGDTQRVAWDEAAEAAWLQQHLDDAFSGGATMVLWCQTAGEMDRFPRVTQALSDYASTL